MKGYYKGGYFTLAATGASRQLHSTTFKCDHPLFSNATLYKKGEFGLLVIQKYYNEKFKVMFWGPVEPWLANDIYCAHGFDDAFNKLSGIKENGLYPIIEVRKLMYMLGMKPMKKEIWEKY